jgi:glycosyltransferase involved in cell wall biosynthesis
MKLMAQAHALTALERPLVSIVITTKNEEKNIRNCLESIRAQTWLRTEVVVVDNNSGDRTQDIAREYTDKVYTKGPERSAQRNFGMIDKSEGEYVIYIDADMILSPSVIEACVAHVRHTGVVALHIPEIVLGKNYFSRVRRFERGFYDGTPIDGARFFHRPIFMQVGGFDERLFEKGSGEDWDIDKLMKRVGRIELLGQCHAKYAGGDWSMCSFIEQRGVAYNPAFHGIYHNEAEFRLFTYLKKKSYYSLGFDGYIKKWGEDDPDIRRQFGVVYRFWTVFTENEKWRRLFIRPDLAMGMYFLRFCVGFVYFLKKIGIVRAVLPSR